MNQQRKIKMARQRGGLRDKAQPMGHALPAG